MHKLILLTITLYISSNLFAQNKEIRLYEQGNYKACLKKSVKRIKKAGDPLIFEQLAGLSQFQVYLRLNKDSVLMESLRHLALSGATPSTSKLKPQRLVQKSMIYNKSEELVSKLTKNGNVNEAKKIGNILYKVYGEYLKQFKPIEVVKVEPKVVKVKESKNAKSMLTNSRKVIGTPYVWGGEMPGGFDCSGFTKYIYKLEEIPLPHSANLQSKEGEEIKKDKLKSGDLVFFATGSDKAKVSHTGIYFNENGVEGMIHSSSSHGVVETHWDSLEWLHYWEPKLIKQVNILPK